MNELVVHPPDGASGEADPCLFGLSLCAGAGGIDLGLSFVRPSGKKAHLGLDQAAKMWPTPMASDGCKPSAGNRKSADLSHASRMWPTPAARDAKGASSRAHVEVTGTGRRHMDQLANFAVHSLPAREITRDGNNTSDQRQTLNPLFVEALMGWPIAWTDFGSVATWWSHWLQRMRFEFCRLGSMPMDEGTLSTKWASLDNDTVTCRFVRPGGVDGIKHI